MRRAFRDRRGRSTGRHDEIPLVIPASEEASGRSIGWSLRRFFAGGALIAVLTMVAISTAAFEAVGSVADLFAKGGLIKSSDLTPTGGGAPTTVLILGSDRRAKTAIDANVPAHSDTILLVHLDPGKGLTSELSIPRDLYVQYRYRGGSYASKINFAYTLGGPKFSLHVVKDLLHIPINYVVDLNFEAFDEVVDKIGCVYVDVDHLYYNPPGTGFAAIDVRPGYQQLCGQHALDYVRYRHDDNTFARDAREQAFLRNAKEQLGVSGLLGHAGGIITALSKSISSNIRGSQEIAGLLETVANSVDGPVRQVRFPNNPLNVNGQDDQSASADEIRAVVRQFLGTTVATPVVHAVAPRRSSRHHTHAGGAVVVPNVPGLSTTPSYVLSDAVALGVNVPFPVYVPALSLASGSPDGFRPFSNYAVRDPQGNVHHGYRIDWSTGSVGAYYGIEGLDWTDPPLFAHANTVDRYGRHYLYVDNGSRVQDVGWVVGKALYWVSNTIFDDLTNAQMFALAESAAPVA
jgi:LCP family protein required for cell wall assembly